MSIVTNEGTIDCAQKPIHVQIAELRDSIAALRTFAKNPNDPRDVEVMATCDEVEERLRCIESREGPRPHDFAEDWCSL